MRPMSRRTEHLWHLQLPEPWGRVDLCVRTLKRYIAPA
jgi:hypothetical protein